MEHWGYTRGNALVSDSGVSPDLPLFQAKVLCNNIQTGLQVWRMKNN